MKQEPIAWLSERLNDGSKRLSFYEPPNTDGNPDYKVEPLYTSPQYRELSDDEIDQTIKNCGYDIEETAMGKFVDIEGINIYNSLCGFARAILERAKK